MFFFWQNTVIKPVVWLLRKFKGKRGKIVILRALLFNLATEVFNSCCVLFFFTFSAKRKGKQRFEANPYIYRQQQVYL